MSTTCEILSAIENIKEPFCERDAGTLIRKMRGEEDASEISMPWVAEYMAFDFYESRSDSVSIWGTYFGPMWYETNGDGKAYESPSIKMVTTEILNHWANRAKQAKHPILKARYAALVWDFSKEVQKKSAEIEMAHIWIDNVILIAKTTCHKYESHVIKKLEKVLNIAISINDASRIEKVKDAILAYELKISSNGKSGRWGFSFDSLLMNKKIRLGDEERDSIINDLEQKLDITSNICDKKSFDQFAAKDAAIRLAQYYQKQNKPEDVKRVLLKYGSAFEHTSKEASGSLAVAWLQVVESIYRNFGLKEEADKVLNIIRQRGPDAQKDLKPFTCEQSISREQMDNYVNEMIKGDIDKVMARIAFQYIPNKNEVAQKLKDLAKEYPVSFLFPAVIQDHNGRTVAQIGSLEDDFDSHLIRQISQDIQFSSIFLRNVLHKFQDVFSISSDSIIVELSKSPVFTKEKTDIVKKGLDAYFSGDHLVAIHLLIPQIECAIRKLLELAGGTTYRPGRSGAYFVKTFDEMIREEMIIQSIGEDATLYFRILYTDQRGWNLRNDVCHGISLPKEFCIQVSDRVFHTLLLLSQIREQKEQEKHKHDEQK